MAEQVKTPQELHQEQIDWQKQVIREEHLDGDRK